MFKFKIKERKPLPNWTIDPSPVTRIGVLSDLVRGDIIALDGTGKQYLIEEVYKKGAYEEVWGAQLTNRGYNGPSHEISPGAGYRKLVPSLTQYN
jgi:hypothetical protein